MPEQVQVDYNKLEEVAGQFHQQAQAIQDMVQKIDGSYTKLVDDKGWIGLGSQAFSNEMMNLVLPTEGRLLDALQAAGDACRIIAQTVRTAEEQASSLFRH